MPIGPRDRPHIHIAGGGTEEAYTSPRRPIRGRPPARIRAEHAERLLLAVGQAVEAARANIAAREAALESGERGFYLEFEIPVEDWEAVDSLENKPNGIELVAVQPVTAEDRTISATVFVPEQAADFFENRIEAYRDEDTPLRGRPKNEGLVARIDDIRLAAVFSLFTDDAALYPADDEEIWWEVWLRDGRSAGFRWAAQALDIQVQEHTINFPEREVVLARSRPSMMGRIVANTDAVAELRIAKDIASIFMQMRAIEQVDWARNLLERMRPAPRTAPVVCLLDSGANRAHPLLENSLAENDQYTFRPEWGVGDSAYWNGHGTQMAGMALYGDLQQPLGGSGGVVLTHRLETVKILPPAGQNRPELYGAITETGMGLAEEGSPGRRRTFCMAVSSEIGLGRGRPSSWSAAVDKLCYNGGALPRLLVLAAGNLRGPDPILPADYPDRNDLVECESPAQAWNAIVAGACTDKINIVDNQFWGWRPLAPAGELCPSSRTSGIWDRQWPVRPDIVFEGGNFAYNGNNPAEPIDDLQLVTTHFRPNIRLFDAFGDTSSATALTAKLTAGILAVRPELWPETVRGLVVHSAEWTRAMRARFAGSQTMKASMLRRYGWGVPDLGRALWSASNDATLMIEDQLFPLRKDGSAIKSGNMNMHRLPWPRDDLRALGGLDVEIRVTLSYFIEPNPGERGWARRHRYASHGLRFALKRSLETLGQFRQRINKAAEDEDAAVAGPMAGGDNWHLGPTTRDKGSMHSDIWRGTAAELADRDAIGIYPVGGWWKEKPQLRRWDRSARYALIVSLRAHEAEIDLHTAIVNRIAAEIPAG
jgi:Subtilase family